MSQSTISIREQNVTSGAASATTYPEEKKLENPDVGVAVLNGMVDELNCDSSEARRVVWKIDLFLLPILSITYMLQVSVSLCCRLQCH